MKFTCLLFDLDGTLIDSRDDLADSVNLTLSELNLANLPSEMIYNFIGEGVFNLINRSISASLKREAEIEFSNHGVEIFRKIYAENCLIKTKLYEGVSETLDELGDYQKAVITNKPWNFSVQILEGLGILRHFKIVCGGDSFAERKPSPVPLVQTAKRLNCLPEECLMIGDSWVDIEAGKNANIKTCGCIFGFRGRDELEKVKADFLIEKFSELTQIL
ncbi:MAG TPA: HAD-IA family hydrolase [Pyrinomonadaceae bacterium]|nr:HAD-IA family hydrolase [Pyrinomonadaceae bacterium]